MTDDWGIADGFHDVQGIWHATDPSVAEQIHAAMIRSPNTDAAPGADLHGDQLPPSPGADLHGANGEPLQGLRFTRSDTGLSIAGRAELVLEDGTTMEVADALPLGLPLGYHQLRDANGTVTTTIVVTPPRAHHFPDRRWGWSVQIPALRDHHSWGIGDLGSLDRFANWVGSSGADVVQTSPLHAPVISPPRDPSPYFPSSRIWRDPNLISISHVLSASHDDIGQRLGTDRDRIWRAKRAALWQHWEAAQPSVDPSFVAWRRKQSGSLEHFAIHEAISERLDRTWPDWPTGLRRHDGHGISSFASANADLVGFHVWLQWLVDRQLTAVAEHVGLITDLAVGVNPRGADAWRFQDQYVDGVHIGAPPDEFNPAGQNWGLCPFDPSALRRARYQPFIEALRANLHHATALRIDHVMGLFRLWWIPTGNPPPLGAYVDQYAVELLDLVCLESHRAGATIIGEDLGTVDTEMRDAMQQRDILGTRLVWFEDRLPSAFPTSCLASISTHDLPTVAGLLDGSDATERELVGVAVDVDADAALVRRLDAAARQGGVVSADDPISYAVAVTRALAGGPAAVVVATLDDALGVTSRPNIPGTTDERANWSIPLPVTVEDLAEQPGVVAMTDAMSSRDDGFGARSGN